MKGPGAFQRVAISILGLAAGFFLFASSLSMLINNMFFDSRFQTNALDKLGIYESVTAFVDTLSSSSDILACNLESINSGIFSDFVNMNSKSLIDGLTEYFKGNTEALPDLNLSSLNSVFTTGNTADAAVMKSMSSPVTGPETINLRALFMYFGERSIAEILLVISLFQFIFSHIPRLGILLFATLFIPMLRKTPFEFRSWLQNTTLTYSILCMAAGLLLQYALFFKLPYLVSIAYKSIPILGEAIWKYITYCSNSFTVQIMLSGTLVFGVVLAVIHVWDRTCLNDINTCRIFHTHIPSFDSTQDTHSLRKQSFVRTVSLVTIIAAFSAACLYMEVRAAGKNFSDRQLGQAISVLKGNSLYYCVTDARNDLVYLLEVKVLDSASKQPVQYLTARVAAKDDTEAAPLQSATASDGTADFLLGKGSFSLVLECTDPLSSYSLPHPLSYEFEMTTPGKAEITIILDSNTNDQPHIKEASIQQIP